MTTLSPGTMPQKDFDFNFCKLFQSVIFEGANVMTKVVHQVYESEKASKRGTVLLKDYIKDELGWNRKDMEGFFTKQNLHLLEANVMSSSFDISIACKILPKLFPKLYTALSKECTDSIEYIKSMRNKLAHVKDPNVNTDIESEIRILGDKYEKVYICVGGVLGHDFSQEVKDTRENLNTILLQPGVKLDLEEYRKHLHEFEKQVSHQLLVEGRSELQKYYERLRVVNPCTWMLQDKADKYSVSKHYIEKIYTPLQITTLSSGEEQKLDTKDILTTTKIKRKNEYILPNGLLFNGLAGCGKTSLCRFILHEWRTGGEEIDTLKDFDFVILVEARSVVQKSLLRFLTEHMFPNTIKKLKQDIKTLHLIGDSIEDDVIPIFQDMRILFIIDGFDEASKDTKKVIRSIFGTFKKNSDHRIIVTTRPEFQEEVGILLNTHHLEYITAKICGFDDGGIDTFTYKVFHIALQDEVKEKNVVENKVEEYTRRKGDTFLEYIRGRGRILNNQLNLPLTLALLIHLWIDDKTRLNRVTNCTSLYHELFSLCQEKVKERLISQEKCTDMPTIKNILLFIGQVSWELLKKDTLSITSTKRKEIEDKCIKKGVEDVEILSAFLACEYDENQDSKELRNYSFLHKTQMEYLAAQYLAEQIKKGDLEEVLGMESWHGFHQVIVFLVGHTLSLTPSPTMGLRRTTDLLFDFVNKADIHEPNFEFWWKFLVEVGKNKEEAAERIAQERLPNTFWELKYEEGNDNLVSGLELLGTIPVRIESLKIEVPNSKDPYDIKHMHDLMVCLKKHLKQYNKYKPLLVELHFWRHCNNSCQRHSDDWVRTLHPWGHLINLTGSLGEQKEGHELLNYCFKLKTIRVRLSTLKAVKNLATSLEKIHRTVRKLRISLAMSPGSVNPESFPSLTSKGDLEIHIPGMKDIHQDWVVTAVKSLSRGRGCDHLLLDNSELSYNAVVYLLKELEGVVISKMSLETVCNITTDMKLKVENMLNNTHILVYWID